MNIPPQPLELGHGHTSPTHPTTIFSSMLVLGMMLPNLPLPLREGMYMQLMVPMISMVLLNPMGHRSLQTLIHPLMIDTRSTKPNMANNHLHPYLDFKDHSRKPTSSTPKKAFKNYDGPVYVPGEVYKLLSPEAVAALKKYNTEAINKFAKKRDIHVTDIAGHESPPSEDTTHEEQPDPHQFEDAPENEIDPILDYMNSQHHQEEDMNNALQAYNVMASTTTNDTP